MVLDVRAAVVVDPLRLWLPTQAPVPAPLPVQLVALVDDHVIILVPPLDTLVGFAVIVTVGAGGADTVTVAEPEALPPAPEQLSP